MTTQKTAASAGAMMEVDLRSRCDLERGQLSPHCSTQSTQGQLESDGPQRDRGHGSVNNQQADDEALLEEGRDPDTDDMSDSGSGIPEEREEESWWMRQMRKPKFWVVVGGVVLFLLLGGLAGTQIYHMTIASKQWFLDNKLISVPWYCFLFSVASAVLMPYGPFCISIGYIFGIGWGFAVQSLAIFASSAFIYVIGRVFLRERVDTWLSQYRLWRAIMEYMGRDHLEAAKINILMCFIPMPYGTHAYLFSISRCAFWNFVSVFEVGMVGHTFLNLAVGDALALASDSDDSSQTLRLVGTVVGAVAMVLSIWYGGVVTQRIMDECYTEEKVMDKLALLNNAAPGGAAEVSVPVDAAAGGEARAVESSRHSRQRAPAPDSGGGVGLGTDEGQWAPGEGCEEEEGRRDRVQAAAGTEGCGDAV